MSVMQGGGRQDGGSPFQGDGIGIRARNDDKQVTTKGKDRRVGGIRHNGKQAIDTWMQREEIITRERKGG